MAVHPSPLPTSLGVVFTTASATAAGVSRGRMRSGDVIAPTRGVRSRAPLSTVDEFARAYAACLPGPFAFSHLTAALLLGVPTPRPWRPGDPLHVIRPSGTALISRRGVTSHRGLERRWTTKVSGLMVTEPADTWADLAGNLDLAELVAVADAMIRVGLVRPKDLERIA